MIMTTHASIRCQQRAIPPFVLDLLLEFGTSEPAGGGTRKVYFDKAARRHVRAYVGKLSAAIEPHLDIYAVVSNDNQIVTAAHRLERIQRH
jgi:hypothetical protein